MIMKTDKFLTLKSITQHYSPEILVRRLGFVEGLRAADAILNNEDGDWDLRYYAVVMLEILRCTCAEMWDSSWIYDGYLSYAYSMSHDEQERFLACARALTRVQSPPPQLLIEFAHSQHSPGKERFLLEVETIQLLKSVLKLESYTDAMDYLSRTYCGENDDGYVYWSTIKEKGKPLPYLFKLSETEYEWTPSPDLLRSLESD